MNTSFSIRLLLFTAFLTLAAAAPGMAGELPKPEETLPTLRILAPTLPREQAYLGISEGFFDVRDVPAKVLLVKIVGVYCPFCHKQTPLFNKLFKRLARAGLDNDVKMLAIASGATEAEVAFLRENSSYLYPVVRDEDYSVHQTLGQPNTPFTMLLDDTGKVRFAHMGVIEDIDMLFNTIKTLLD